MGVQFVFSAAYVTYLSREFDYGERLIALHISVVTAAILLAALALGGVLRVFRSRAAQHAVSLVPAAAFATLTILYGADLVSQRHWGGNITYELMAFYLARPSVLLGYIPIATDWRSVAVIVGFAAAAAIRIARSGIVPEGLTAFFEPAEGDRPRASVRWGVVGVAALLPLSATVALTTTLPPRLRANLLAREPVLGFFLDAASLHQFALSRFATRFVEEGPAVRSGYPDGQNFDRRNVILIVADSLRADHMQVYGYERQTTPHLARLRETGRLSRVDLALATCPDSPCGVSSLMTSKTFGSLVPQNFKLHELLYDQGYAVNFIVSGDHNWYRMKEFYGDDVTFYFDGYSSKKYQPTDDRLIFEGLEQVAPFDRTPAFFYFHLMSSHAIGKRWDPHMIFKPSNSSIFDGDATTMTNSYDNAVVQVDAIIEQVFEALSDKGYLENALVVIVGDHGEGLGERPGPHGVGHRSWLYQTTLRVPLLIYDTLGATYSNLQFATHVDVAPTVVSRLGLQVPLSWEGRSLLDAPVKPYSYHYVDVFPFYAVVHRTGSATYKYLRQSGREELFELTSDPDERSNLMFSADETLVKDLRDRLADVLASTHP